MDKGKKTLKGRALDDEVLEKSSGGYVVYRGALRDVYSYDQYGNKISERWYESDAIKDSRNAGSGFAAMRVSEEDMKNLRENGFFDKDGRRYYNDNTSRRIS